MATSEFFATESPSIGARFRQISVNGFASLARVWRAALNRRSVAKLLDWDDRMLSDIGLTQGDVRSAIVAPIGDDPSQRLRALSVERRSAIRAEARERHEIANQSVRRRLVIAKSERLRAIPYQGH